MINDYKNSKAFGDSHRSRRHPRLGVLALTGLILCASALYAALDTEADPATSEKPVNTTQQQNKSLSAPTQKIVALKLPTPNRQEESSDITAPKIASLATPVKPAPPAANTLPAMDNHATILPASTTETAPEAAVTVDKNLSKPNGGRWLEETVKAGDSLARIFSRLDLSASLLHEIVNSSKQAKQLAKIRPGEQFRVQITDTGELLELIHYKSAIRSLHITPANDTYATKQVDRPLDKQISGVSGTITHSLFAAAQKAGLSDTLTMELANIFGWDIDFALEIRAGDQFSLIYEEKFLDGKKYGNGNILAAEFINRGKTFRAIRFEDDDGRASYFSPDGKSMRKAFLRSPVDFRRISSRFSSSRKHPVFGKRRAHKGVDYAAATGTPIKASGDGRVTFRGRKGGYGRAVIIRHGSQYTTLYAHMSKFRSSVKKGSRVSQGQTIGYVGKSGTATGPHLHYEFRVNGVHRNPLTVNIPAAKPIAKKYRQAFAAVSAQLQSKLDGLATTLVADAQ